jgi:hypothetical protein
MEQEAKELKPIGEWTIQDIEELPSIELWSLKGANG